jgi:hypothetical protein
MQGARRAPLPIFACPGCVMSGSHKGKACEDICVINARHHVPVLHAIAGPWRLRVDRHDLKSIRAINAVEQTRMAHTVTVASCA